MLFLLPIQELVKQPTTLGGKITKLNTTAYHPECNGKVERFNCTLKDMLRREYGTQWDKHLPGVLWAYRNTPHNNTGEKPPFLLFGWDCNL